MLVCVELGCPDISWGKAKQSIGDEQREKKTNGKTRNRRITQRKMFVATCDTRGVYCFHVLFIVHVNPKL